MQLEDEVELSGKLPALEGNLVFEDVVDCHAFESLGRVRKRRLLHRIGSVENLLRGLAVLIQRVGMGTELEQNGN